MIPPPDWLSRDQSYLVGISGGRDSIALHHWLVGHQFEKLTYCHLNHGLRGAESDADQAFLKELLGPALLTERNDVAALARRERLSLETAAREARHRFFRKCADETGIPRILLAHHADDQAETILFNLLRGSAGAKGMSSSQPIGPLTFLRPFLEIRRHEIDALLAEKQLPFREDSSNSEPFAARNRLRQEALPLLQEILNRDPVPALLRAHQHTRELEKIADFVLESLDLLDPQGRIHLPTLRPLPVALQKRALHQYLRNHEIPDLSNTLIENGLALLQPDAPPSLNLPGGLRLRRKEARLLISP